MPEIWGEKKPEDLDRPKTVRVKKPKIDTELPDFLKDKAEFPEKTRKRKRLRLSERQSRPLLCLCGRLRRP